MDSVRRPDFSGGGRDGGGGAGGGELGGSEMNDLIHYCLHPGCQVWVQVEDYQVREVTKDCWWRWRWRRRRLRTWSGWVVITERVLHGFDHVVTMCTVRIM